MCPERWLERYCAGEHADVWAELVALGPAVREEPARSAAETVAAETMQRVRANVETLTDRLREAGYEFAVDPPHIPPDRDLSAHVAAVETRAGPLPMSLRAFYEIVGIVNFTQSLDQLVQWHEPRRRSASELEVLGEYDPLVVGPLDDRWASEPGFWAFSMDEFHKANYSGGDNYQVALPEPGADFVIRYVDELFVAFLRATFRGGGFRGKLDADEERAWKLPPDLELAAMLADGLLPI